MKGDRGLIDTLNVLLAEELTAINQYVVHSEMVESWGYGALYKELRATSISEMKHAEALISRILFLEGLPQVSKLNDMHIGKNVEEIVLNDYTAEIEAVKAYNAAIKQAMEVGDHGTRDLLASILKDEEAHIDWAEEQRDQIAQMGIGSYLSTKAR